MITPSLDRLATQTAKICSVVAWAALAYAFFNDSTVVAMGGSNHTIVPVNIFSIVALISGFFGVICSLPGLNYDISDLSAWLFAIWCSLPFLLIKGLLNPFPGLHHW